MALYIAVYEHRHGTDIVQFKTDCQWDKLYALISADREALAKLIGIDDFEPHRGESYEIYNIQAFRAPEIDACVFTAALVKAKLTA